MAQEDTEGSGRSHQGSNPPLLQQYDLSIYLARNPVCHARTKHIEVHYHFIRERVQAGDIDLQHIRTNFQMTDIFTNL